MEEVKTDEAIPHGPYCYGSLSPMDERGIMRVHGKCPYWESRGERLAYCRYLQQEDDFILWDQVKICGVNDGEPDPSTVIGGEHD